MIVCSCHVVSDRALRDAVAAGLSHQQVVEATGAGTGCGCCTETIASIVAEGAGPCRGADACPGCPRRAAA
ncbi:MAG TPA: (2Fe-2S)-binding protein [Anaeromyxobacteraceae bacterium]